MSFPPLRSLSRTLPYVRSVRGASIISLRQRSNATDTATSTTFTASFSTSVKIKSNLHDTQCQFPVLPDTVETWSSDFKSNKEEMDSLVASLDSTIADIKEGGGPALRERHEKRNKLFAMLCFRAPFPILHLKISKGALGLRILRETAL